jgi:ribosomal protein L29
MKKKELNTKREISIEELRSTVNELKQKKALIQGNMSSGNEKNTKAAKALKTDIAQIMTIISEKQKKAEETRKEDKVSS